MPDLTIDPIAAVVAADHGDARVCAARTCAWACDRTSQRRRRHPAHPCRLPAARRVGRARRVGIGIVLLYATFFAAVARNDHLAFWGVFPVEYGRRGDPKCGVSASWHPASKRGRRCPCTFEDALRTTAGGGCGRR